jgi:hypothetical protein
MANQGKDAGKVVSFTAYHDLSDLAERFVAILPAYVNHLVVAKAAKQWFHADSLASLKDVEFLHDDAGNWSGTWKIPEDDLMQDILDEDMNVQFQFEGINHLEHSMVRLTTDDASVFTFGPALGHHSTGEENRDNVAATAHKGRGGETA